MRFVGTNRFGLVRADDLFGDTRALVLELVEGYDARA